VKAVTVAAEVPPAQIVAVDDYDVRCTCGE